MALFDFFKKNKEKERFLRKQKEKKAKDKPSVFSGKKAGGKEAVVFDELKPIRKKTKNKEEVILKTSEPKSEILVLKQPYITEKTTDLREKQNAYAFKVLRGANKIMIKRAVEILYKTKVEKVNIVKKPPKQMFVKGKKGRKPGFKKAIVFLKEGEKIEV